MQTLQLQAGRFNLKILYWDLQLEAFKPDLAYWLIHACRFTAGLH
jgi:hypothetical protein